MYETYVHAGFPKEDARSALKAINSIFYNILCSVDHKYFSILRNGRFLGGNPVQKNLSFLV